MSAEMPELGSKISLISKADIRYEGRLFTVDPRECTIALASVRSFGTEDRDTKYPVAPQNQVYDYILFRGSDIKDIRVVNNNVIPNDPAIMQLSVPPSLGPQPYPQPNFGHPVLGHMAPQMGQFQPYGGGLGPIGANLPSGLAPGMGMQRGVPKQQPVPSELIGGNSGSMGSAPGTDIPNIDQGVRSNDSDLISGGSRSTTPVSLTSRKSPTNDAGVQVNSSGGPSGSQDDKKGGQQRPIQPPGGQQRIRRESGGRQNQGNQNRNQPQRNLQNQQNIPGHQDQRNQQNQNQRQGWGGNNNRGIQMRPRGRGRNMQGSGSGSAGGYRNQQGGQSQNQAMKVKNLLKFDNDYDFEQANTEFEELRSQLAKVKIDEPNKSTELNGDVEKKDDSGNETGAGENEVEEESEIFYDSKKSFFDNISCEAVERSKGRSQRTDWRTERKLNSETFGVASARRGGYRGRGGYYNRGGMGGYRGGYRNYRTNQGPNQRSRPSQSQNNPQQNQNASQSTATQSRPITTATGSNGK
ncbi:protein LSM14 homolog B-A isoform X2 [Chrysoperla carnea]|uniref:protein LSM14 homolog B-A isoform X2 n=1 Tax=Chrysoperla carnea TaxID=189513 RepID=UPI001D06AA22|nr:protein LSM14 homolog B-A isoform X2 [Chrysoperla carnea]